MTKTIILFTRVPKEGTTKTRLYDFLTPKQAVEVQKNLLKNLYNNLLLWGYDVVVYHSGNKSDDRYMNNILDTREYFYQEGNNLGEKMDNAFRSEFLKGKKKILLLGSDIVGITKEVIDTAFSSLNTYDVVLNPTYDGGYCLVGLSKPNDKIFNLPKYGTKTVFEETLNSIKGRYSYFIGKVLLDIDTKEDLLTYATGFEGITLLGAGEYNINFLYNHSSTERRVLRLNMKSQMNLTNQMAYEYETLKILEKSSVTPKPYILNEEKKIIPYAYLTEQYLPGRALNYDTDMEIAAYLLAKVHTSSYPEENRLIKATNPFKLMYEECLHMATVYMNWKDRKEEVCYYLNKFLNRCKELLDKEYELGKFCIINTELNSGNFLIGKTKYDSYIIDWEKALIGECEQDLAHFLAPTTTYWKTDVILTREEIMEFLRNYDQYNSYNKEKFEQYLIFNCLRGVTWCSMAYRDYCESEKILTDDFTFMKIKSYLDIEFLQNLEENYF